MNDWNIQSRSHECNVSNKKFDDKERYRTLLKRQKGGFERLDVCEEIWEKHFKEKAGKSESYVSQWQGVYRAPDAKPEDPIKKDNAESLLKKLVERNQPEHEGACFILAVMLERKRLLKVVEEEKLDEGRRLLTYEPIKGGESFVVLDPNLKLRELEEVQKDVADLLENGLPDEVASPEVEPEDESAEEAASPENEGPDDVENAENGPPVADDQNDKDGPLAEDVSDIQAATDEDAGGDDESASEDEGEAKA